MKEIKFFSQSKGYSYLEIYPNILQLGKDWNVKSFYDRKEHSIMFSSFKYFFLMKLGRGENMHFLKKY